jgi:rsbT antagonist protein RsbS
MSDQHQIPIIRLWHLLLVPLQGDIGDDAAARLTSDVLDRLHEEDATGLVIDITGLWMVDSHLCATLSRLAASAALMGARTVVSGMKPDIALTLETMGVSFGVRTTLNLEAALQILGVRSATADSSGVEIRSAVTVAESVGTDAGARSSSL